MAIVVGGVAVMPGMRLDERELSVLDGLARGLTHPEIGARLGLEESTIRTYSRRARIKLGALNTPHAVALGFVRGYLQPHERVKS